MDVGRARQPCDADQQHLQPPFHCCDVFVVQHGGGAASFEWSDFSLGWIQEGTAAADQVCDGEGETQNWRLWPRAKLALKVFVCCKTLCKRAVWGPDQTCLLTWSKRYWLHTIAALNCTWTPLALIPFGIFRRLALAPWTTVPRTEGEFFS